MNLPDLAFGWRKLKSDILAIRGINYSDAITDGDLADSEGISTRRFPYIATLRGRAAAESWLNEKNPSSVHRYNDHIIAVCGEELLCDNKKIGVVAPGEKQFCTINTKVVIYPDKLMLDMAHNPPVIRDMAASFVTVGSGTELSHNKITIPNTPLSDKPALSASASQSGNNFMKGYWFHTYKGLKWDGGKYTWDSVEWKEIMGEGSKGISAGDILIPIQDNAADALRAQMHLSDDYRYAPSEDKKDDITQGGGYYLQVKSVKGYVNYVSNGRVCEDVLVSFNVYNFAEENPKLKTVLRKGDAVSISGHPLSVNNKEIAMTIDVTDDALIFADNTFVPAAGYAAITKDTEKDNNPVGFVNVPSTGKCLTVATDAKGKLAFETLDGELIDLEEGQTVAYSSGDDPSAWLIAADEKVHPIKATRSDAVPTDYTTLSATRIDSLSLKITRAIPDMDYICEKDNRLWGVVNKQHNRVWDDRLKKWAEFDSRMIVASSLGMPDDFYDYNGVYSGAYAVAVASDGDFTGICAYGDSILAWKEKKLCKVLGDSPSSYAMHDYTMDGLQSGAQGTQVNIKESLIYKGVNGIYAYGGGVSRLISPQFGERRYSAKSAGTDGERYYITLIDKDGKHHLHSYDIERGIWLRESGDNATGYIDLPDGGFSALVKLSDTESVVKRMDTGADDSSLAWYAQFAPLYETLDGKKRYAKLLLRLEIEKGANVQIKERVDGKPWMLIGRITGSTQSIVTIPVPIVRGDKVEFRLEGKGACTILGIQRQFYMGSEV